MGPEIDKPKLVDLPIQSDCVSIAGSIPGSLVLAQIEGRLCAFVHDSHIQAISDAQIRAGQLLAPEPDFVGSGMLFLKGDGSIKCRMEELAFTVNGQQLKDLICEAFPGREVNLRTG